MKLHVKKSSVMIWVVYFLTFFIPTSLYAVLKNELPGIEWERRLGDNKFYYSTSAIAVSPEDQSIIIAGTAKPLNGSGEAGHFWIWRLDQNGKKIQEIPITRPDENKSIRRGYPYVRSLIVLENGDILAIVEFMPGRPSIVKIARTGKRLYTKAIPNSKDDTRIAKILATTDGNLLLLGSKNADSFLLKLDPKGEVLWRKRIRRDQPSTLVDGLALKDGGALLVGNLGRYYEFGGRVEISVWKVDAKGELLSEDTFVGSRGSIAKYQNDNYVMVYNNNYFTTEDRKAWTNETWIQALNADLEPLWKRRVRAVEKGWLGQYQIAVTRGLVLVGSELLRLSVIRLDSAGEEIWSYYATKGLDRFSPSFHVASRDNEFFILHSVPSYKDGKSNNKVGVIKFIVK